MQKNAEVLRNYSAFMNTVYNNNAVDMIMDMCEGMQLLMCVCVCAVS